MKRDDSSEISETFLPQTLDEEEAEDDDDYDTEEYEKQLLLRERLREYLLEEKLDAIRSQIADEGDDYDDVGDEWLRSRLSPAYANIYSGFMPALFSSCRQNVLEKKLPSVHRIEVRPTATHTRWTPHFLPCWLAADDVTMETCYYGH